MKAFLYDPGAPVSALIELPDHQEQYAPRINELLGCEQFLSLGTREDTLHVCVDPQTIDPRKQAKCVNGLTAPIYGRFLIVGFQPLTKRFISVPSSFEPSEIEMVNITMEEARKRIQSCCLEAMFKYEDA